MPNPYSGGPIDMSDAPGGDFNLDDLFPNPEVTANDTVADSSVPPAPQEPDTLAEEFYLKTPTGTVYKTKDDAVRGFSHKDEVIERLRARFRNELGVDPLDDKAQPTAKPNSNAPKPDVANDPLAFWNESAAAIKANDPVKYMQVFDEWLQARMGPYVPYAVQGARQQAMDTVSAEIPDFRAFRTGAEFSEALEANPILKQAVEQSESNVQYAGQLPGLYKLVYLTSRGLKANEIVRSSPAPTPPPTGRPTITSSTATPEPGGARPDLTTSAGRKAIIEAAERRGVADVDWNRMGQ